MDIMICGLLFIAVLLYLAYRGYRVFAKNEITTCLGEHYRWKDERKEINCTDQKKTGLNIH